MLKDLVDRLMGGKSPLKRLAELDAEQSARLRDLEAADLADNQTELADLISGKTSIRKKDSAREDQRRLVDRAEQAMEFLIGRELESRQKDLPAEIAARGRVLEEGVRQFRPLIAQAHKHYAGLVECVVALGLDPGSVPPETFRGFDRIANYLLGLGTRLHPGLDVVDVAPRVSVPPAPKTTPEGAITELQNRIWDLQKPDGPCFWLIDDLKAAGGSEGLVERVKEVWRITPKATTAPAPAPKATPLPVGHSVRYTDRGRLQMRNFSTREDSIRSARVLRLQHHFKDAIAGFVMSDKSFQPFEDQPAAPEASDADSNNLQGDGIHG